MRCQTALLLGFILLLSGCTGYKYQPNSLPEELIEEAIDYKFNVDIDLSGSGEKGFNPKVISPLSKERDL